MLAMTSASARLRLARDGERSARRRVAPTDEAAEHEQHRAEQQHRHPAAHAEGEHGEQRAVRDQVHEERDRRDGGRVLRRPRQPVRPPRPPFAHESGADEGNDLQHQQLKDVLELVQLDLMPADQPSGDDRS